jgi:quercetin dioxygenase-like cupin family protein
MKPINEKSFVMSDDIDWETTDNGVQRKVLSYDDELMLVHVRFERGAIGRPHSHFHRQVSYIESGSFEVIIDDDNIVLRKGDSFIVKPNVNHSVIALEKGSIIDIFTPAREEFI